MTRSVDQINLTNFVVTGTSSITQATFTIKVTWTDDNGVQHVYGPTTKTFPDDIGTMPLLAQKQFAIAMVTAFVRVTLGIDSWSQYQ